ncbi:MAG: hypothetical protein LBD96_07590 [Treponema sp.]|jgi:hypothetical protein|nr:hypothetical protein [Treponema sp.]
MNIGGRRELFWDDAFLEECTAGFRQAIPEKKEVVMVLDRPWEGNTCCYFHAFHDGEKYRMYYRGSHGIEYKDPKSYICMLTSADGITWERPELGIFDFDGEKTNIVLQGNRDAPGTTQQIDPGAYHPAGEHSKLVDNFFVFLDTKPHCPPAERFKAISVGTDPGERTPRPGSWGWEYATLWGYSSPDGLHWTRMPQSPLLTKGGFDSLNTVRWDSLKNEYRLYYRDFHQDRSRPSGVVRDIRTSTSKDFIQWTESVPLSYGDAPDEELYTNQILPYYRAPHIIVGFPTRYTERKWEPMFEQLPNVEWRRKKSALNLREGTALTDGFFMFSRDGINFHRWDEPFLRPGLARRHNWVYGDGYQSWGLIETPAEDPYAPPEISFFAGEDYKNQDRALSLRRYTVRLDGFAYLHAAREPRTALTRPFVFEGRTLTLNVSTGAAGFIMVEFLSPENELIPGYSGNAGYKMFGDDIALKVLFRRGDSADSDVASLSGKPVRIRFTLSEARLYSMQFIN